MVPHNAVVLDIDVVLGAGHRRRAADELHVKCAHRHVIGVLVLTAAVLLILVRWICSSSCCSSSRCRWPSCSTKAVLHVIVTLAPGVLGAAALESDGVPVSVVAEAVDVLDSRMLDPDVALN